MSGNVNKCLMSAIAQIAAFGGELNKVDTQQERNALSSFKNIFHSYKSDKVCIDEFINGKELDENAALKEVNTNRTVVLHPQEELSDEYAKEDCLETETFVYDEEGNIVEASGYLGAAMNGWRDIHCDETLVQRIGQIASFDGVSGKISSSAEANAVRDLGSFYTRPVDQRYINRALNGDSVEKWSSYDNAVSYPLNDYLNPEYKIYCSYVKSQTDFYDDNGKRILILSDEKPMIVTDEGQKQKQRVVEICEDIGEIYFDTKIQGETGYRYIKPGSTDSPSSSGPAVALSYLTDINGKRFEFSSNVGIGAMEKTCLIDGDLSIGCKVGKGFSVGTTCKFDIVNGSDNSLIESGVGPYVGYKHNGFKAQAGAVYQFCEEKVAPFVEVQTSLDKNAKVNLFGRYEHNVGTEVGVKFDLGRWVQ